MVERLFRIVYVLMNQETVTCAKLAEQMECSTRTIMRDIDKLSMAGIPIFTNKGKGGGISLLPDFVLDKAVLDDTERSQILSSLQAISETGYGEEQMIFDKLRSLFGTEMSDWIEIEFSRWGEPEKEEFFFKQLKSAILKHQIIELTYATSQGTCSVRKVKPRKLCYRGHAWYLYGFCLVRNENRFFKLKRMVELLVTEENFVPLPPEKVLKEPMEQTENTMLVKIKVFKEQLYRVLEELPHGILSDDGSMITEFSTNDKTAIVNYILSLGDGAFVLEPRWLQEAVKDQIDKMKKRYEEI